MTVRTLPLLLTLLLLVISLQSAVAQSLYSRSTIDIGLVVADMDASLAFYEQVLGMERVGEFAVDGPTAKRLGLTSGGAFNAVMLRLGDEEGAPTLKLVNAGETDRFQPEHIHDQSGIRYLTVFVSALNPMVERVQGEGITLLGETPVQLGGGSNYLALIQDPDGVFIELIGPLEAVP